MHKFEFERGKMVPVPSHSIVPERDVNSAPVLEALHLGIDFGGLKAVDDFNLTIGKTEIAGLIGPNGAGKTTVFNLQPHHRQDRDRRPDRPQRRRQDHGLQPAHQGLRAHARHDPAQRQRHER